LTFAAVEPRKQRLVRLTSSRRRHILRRHPEVAALAEALKDTVTAPDVVLASGKLPNVELYYKRLREGKFGWLWLKVVVSFDARGEGEITTAFLVYNITGGEVLWLPPHLKLI
jgi:hypothetical protein